MTETTRSSDQDVSLELEAEKVNGHGHKRLSRPAVKLWLASGGLLGVSLLPCPECGTPMIFHTWPLVGMVLVAQAIKKRTLKERIAPAGGAHHPVVHLAAVAHPDAVRNPGEDSLPTIPKDELVEP